MRGAAHERGAALVAVLALVLLLAGFATIGLQRLRAATDRLADGEGRAQAELLAETGVRAALAMALRVKAEARQGVPPGQPRQLLLGEARVALRFADAGTCFNLNSLARRSDDATPDATVADFQRLLVAAGIPLLEASRLAQATAAALGRTGLLWADPSEWVTVPGVTAAHWRAAAPLLCTLPTREAATMNVNALTPEKAPLLVAMGLSPDEARRATAQRPREGWQSANEFWSAASSSGMPAGAAAAVTGITSRWMEVDVVAQAAGARAARHGLMDTLRSPAVLVAVEWRPPPEAARV